MRDLRDYTLICPYCNFKQQANREKCVVCEKPLGNTHAKQFLSLRKTPTKLLDRGIKA